MGTGKGRKMRMGGDCEGMGEELGGEGKKEKGEKRRRDGGVEEGRLEGWGGQGKGGDGEGRVVTETF